MNAYELANQLQGVISVLNVHHEEDCLFIANECQYMLRQLADRIKELEKCIEDCYPFQKQQAGRIAELEKWEERWSKRCQRQQDRIAELEDKLSFYELKNLDAPQTKPSPDGLIDPKSYFAGYEDGKVKQVNTPCEHEIVDARNEFVESGYMCIKCMSLFKGRHITPQTKQLNDEEIIRIWNTCETDANFEQLVMKDFILFARAIEAKVRGQ